MRGEHINSTGKQATAVGVISSCLLFLQTMPVLQRFYFLLVALSVRLNLTVRAECSKDCASCTHQLSYHADLNPLVSIIYCFFSEILYLYSIQQSCKLYEVLLRSHTHNTKVLLMCITYIDYLCHNKQ